MSQHTRRLEKINCVSSCVYTVKKKIKNSASSQQILLCAKHPILWRNESEILKLVIRRCGCLLKLWSKCSEKVERE